MSTHWWRPVLMAIAGLAAGTIIVATAWALVTVLQAVGDIRDAQESFGETQQASRKTQKSSRELLNAIKDCTEPTGECYQESEARDAEQIGAFNAAVIAAAWCALQNPETHRELTACVVKILDGKGHK